MKNKKIIIAGGAGFIGRELCNYFGPENEIVVLSRQIPGDAGNTYGVTTLTGKGASNTRYVQWDGIHQGNWTNEINNADLVINLAGKSVNCRYTSNNKQEIMSSRLNATKAIGLAIQQAIHPPALWINAASATIYPAATNIPRDENFTEFSNDFSAQVCLNWENTFYDQRTPFTRKCALRLAITLGTGGVMIPYLNLLKFGLGGRQGDGKQMYSWVHIEDVCRMIAWLAENNTQEGTFNCSSPAPVTNSSFMQTLRKATGKRFGLAAYTWMLTIGALMIGTETELILKSRWVLPKRVIAAGFQFKYPLLPAALDEIVAKIPRRQYQLF